MKTLHTKIKAGVTFFLISLLFLSNLNAQYLTAITSGQIYGGTAISSKWGDFNNDGYPDLFARNLHFNNGDGTFTQITEGDVAATGSGIGATTGDYDHAGYLDLYTGAFTQLPQGGGKLYHNNGVETFTQILEEPFLSDNSDILYLDKVILSVNDRCSPYICKT